MFGKKENRSDLEVFTLFDTKASFYDQPVFAKNKDVLLRDLLNLFNDPQQRSKSTLWTNAEDYQVFRIGSYSKETGILSTQNLEHVANLHDLKALANTGEGQVGMFPT